MRGAKALQKSLDAAYWNCIERFTGHLIDTLAGHGIRAAAAPATHNKAPGLVGRFR
jgi:hypothetical protein